MDLNTLLLSIGAMGGLGALFSTGLSIADKKLRVEEDPRIGKILDELPGANCGGCGYPGCGNFADNIVTGKVQISGCPVSSDYAIEAIAGIMGVEANKGERMIARVFCQGGIAETAIKADYVGIQSCIAVNLLGGGEKLCENGCLGFGDCIKACPFDAMYMSANGLPVVIEEKCTGCGNCVEACRRSVIELHPTSHSLFILCKNQDKPKDARKACTKACIGCGICVRAVEDNQIYIENNLAYINYESYGKVSELPTDKCPTGCMVVINEKSSEELIKEAA